MGARAGAAAARAGAAPAAPAPGGVATLVAAAGPRIADGVALRWRRRVTARVTGPVTGLSYAVSATAPVVVADRMDVEGLLATGYFAQVG